MVCESLKGKLDMYLDGELPEEEMRNFDSHVRICVSCSSEALGRVQMKRAFQVAGKRFTPSAEFRQRIEQSIASKPTRRFAVGSLRLGWIFATAAVVLVSLGLFVASHLSDRSAKQRIFSEIADLHVGTLASSSPVDVISTDRHTVKPWFQGKIPFAFNLPELQNSEFSLLGGRMTYLEQTPGAHLIYDVRKHHISVFVFQERSLPARLSDSAPQPGQLSFHTETWSQGGLRYFVIGDASAADIDSLAKLFKATS
jgi:anti-sigma factor RsiW